MTASLRKGLERNQRIIHNRNHSVWQSEMLARPAKNERSMGLRPSTVVQDGDDGVTAVFHVDDFETVAELLKPRRGRQVSEHERARLAAMGRASLERHRYVIAQAPKTSLETHEAHLSEPRVA
jgi:hypothetical protein